MCNNEVSHFSVSPDNKFKAVVFNRNCGATTGFNTQISIINIDSQLQTNGGNIFIMDNKENITLEWSSNNQLVVKGNLNNETFKKLQEFKGIHISYN